MKTAIAHLEGKSAYSQSRHYADDVPELPKELKRDYEERTWRNRLHTDKQGHVVIPGPAFANCLKTAAKRLKIRIPGKGRVEFTKYFEAGVMCTDGITLKVQAKDVACEKLFVPSDGQVGGGKRVTKYFPRIDSWSGQVTFYIFDDVITKDVFAQVLESAGRVVGIGRFRPENRGYYGRFSVEKLEWNDDSAGDAAGDSVGDETGSDENV